MTVFRIDSTKAILLRAQPFQSAEHLQEFFEINLNALLGLRFIASNIPTRDYLGGKIETLGIDSEHSPVVINYEKPGKSSEINKGVFYFDWMIEHKTLISSFILKALGGNFPINWGQPRLIIVGQNFTEYDRHTLEQITKSIELWEYQKFDDVFVTLSCYYKKLRPNSNPPITKIVAPASRAILHQDNDNSLHKHLKEIPESTKDLFYELRRRIIGLNSSQQIQEFIVQTYIGYRHKRNICELWVQKEQIKIWLDIPFDLLEDPFKLARNVKGIGHWGTGDVEIKVRSSTNLNHIIDLISQSEKFNR